MTVTIHRHRYLWRSKVEADGVTYIADGLTPDSAASSMLSAMPDDVKELVIASVRQAVANAATPAAQHPEPQVANSR